MVNPYILFTDRLDARIVSIVMRVIRNLEDNGIIMFVSFINPRFIYSNLLARQVIFFSIYSYYSHIYYLLHSMLFLIQLITNSCVRTGSIMIHTVSGGECTFVHIIIKKIVD